MKLSEQLSKTLEYLFWRTALLTAAPYIYIAPAARLMLDPTSELDSLLSPSICPRRIPVLAAFQQLDS